MSKTRVWYERHRLIFDTIDKTESIQIPIRAGIDYAFVMEQYFQTADCWGIEVVIRYRVVEK